MAIQVDVQGALENAQDRVTGWVEGAISALPSVVSAVLVLLVFWGLSRLFKRWVRSVADRFSEYEQVNRLLARIVGFGVLAVGIFVALAVLDLSRTVTSLLAGAGIVGLAIGFAAQDSMENLIAGVVISIRRPFRIGQVLETNDHMGVVEDINLRSTIVRSFQGQLVVIPNSSVYANPIVNYSDLGQRRVDLTCGVGYGDDLENARKVATEAIEGLDRRIRSRPVEVFFEEFGGSSINFVVRFWIDFSGQTDFLAARSDAIIALKKALDDAGLNIPFPIRTLDFGPPGGVRLSEELSELDLGAEPSRNEEGART